MLDSLLKSISNDIGFLLTSWEWEKDDIFLDIHKQSDGLIELNITDREGKNLGKVEVYVKILPAD